MARKNSIKFNLGPDRWHNQELWERDLLFAGHVFGLFFIVLGIVLIIDSLVLTGLGFLLLAVYISPISIIKRLRKSLSGKARLLIVSIILVIIVLPFLITVKSFA